MDQYIETTSKLDETWSQLKMTSRSSVSTFTGVMEEYDNWRDSTVVRIVFQDFHSIDSW